MSRSRHSSGVSSVQRTRPENTPSPSYPGIPRNASLGSTTRPSRSLRPASNKAFCSWSAFRPVAVANMAHERPRRGSDLQRRPSRAQTVRKVLEELSGKGVGVVFGRVNPYLLADMRRHRITELIGEGDSSPRCTRRSTRSGPKARKFDPLRSTPQRVGVHGALEFGTCSGASGCLLSIAN